MSSCSCASLFSVSFTSLFGLLGAEYSLIVSMWGGLHIPKYAFLHLVISVLLRLLTCCCCCSVVFVVFVVVELVVQSHVVVRGGGIIEMGTL